MQYAAILQRPLLIAKISLPEMLRWYVIYHPISILKSYWAYLRAVHEIFSFVFLLRTLISPWKQIVDPYPSQLLNIGRVTQVLTLNCLSRSVGMLIRLGAIVFGLCVVAILSMGFVAYFALWFAFPVLLFTHPTLLIPHW